MADKKPTGLYAKMAAIMGQIDKVEKDAKMNAGALNYKYVTDVQVYHTVRKLMVEYGIALFASMIEAQQERIITGEDKYGNPKDKYHTLAKFQFVLVDSETGDTMTCVWHGEADDSGDKGVNKSSTAALKYWLLKTFIIPTGDDPDGVPSGQPAPNPRRIPDAAPPTDNRLVKPEPAQTPDNGAAGADESHWTNDMARLRKFLAWAEDFWKPIERPHAVNRLANALGINGTPAGKTDMLFEMMLAQQDTVGTPDQAMRAVQLYEPNDPPREAKLLPDKDAMPFDGPCDMCGETTVLTVAGGTFRCKACSDKVANEAASALAQKRGKGKKLEPTGTDG